MKKLYLLFVLAFFTSCKQDCLFSDITENSPDNCNPNRSVKIGYAEAVAIAQHGIAILESEPTTRSESSVRRIDSEKTKYFIEPTTRSRNCSDTLMYVFNFADSAGFALVAADRRADPLLAVTENGNYTPGETTGNPGFDQYMECAQVYLRSVIGTPYNPHISGIRPTMFSK